MNPKKSFQPRKHTQTQCIPGAAIHYLVGDGGAGVKVMIWSVIFRVIPWLK